MSKKKSPLHLLIKARGLSIKFLEDEASLPRNTLYNYVSGSYPLPSKHIPVIKKVLKKHKINFAM